MPNVCVYVEWIFGDIVKCYFLYADFKKNLKVSVGQTGKIYANVFYN